MYSHLKMGLQICDLWLPESKGSAKRDSNNYIIIYQRSVSLHCRHSDKSSTKGEAGEGGEESELLSERLQCRLEKCNLEEKSRLL